MRRKSIPPPPAPRKAREETAICVFLGAELCSEVRSYIPPGMSASYVLRDVIRAGMREIGTPYKATGAEK